MTIVRVAAIVATDVVQVPDCMCNSLLELDDIFGLNISKFIH